MNLDSSLLELTEQFLRTTIAPHANVIDHESETLGEALQQLGKRSLLALRVSRQWGGAEVSDSTFCQFQEMLARYSGALAFLQAQHQSAGNLLMRSENESLKAQYLPKMGSGEALVGISFAHLRRQPPPVQAIEVAGGYQISGFAPWVTGYKFFQTFLVAAVTADGRAVYGMVPFQTTEQHEGGSIRCGEPMALAAMTSTATVTVEFREYFLAQEQVVTVTSAAAIHKSDRLNVLQHSFFALGCARAGLDILEKVAQEKPLPFLQSTYDGLNCKLLDCRQSIFAAPRDNGRFEQNVQLRARAIDLATRCAQAAVIASGGAANSLYHPAQRVYREALVYSVAGQTTATMEATLQRLLARNPSHQEIENF